MESDSECSTEGTSSNYGSDDDLDGDSDDGLQMVDARAEEIEVQEVMVGGSRRGLITLGEEITRVWAWVTEYMQVSMLVNTMLFFNNRYLHIFSHPRLYPSR